MELFPPTTQTASTMHYMEYKDKRERQRVLFAVINQNNFLPRYRSGHGLTGVLRSCVRLVGRTTDGSRLAGEQHYTLHRYCCSISSQEIPMSEHLGKIVNSISDWEISWPYPTHMYRLVALAVVWFVSFELD